MEPAILNHTNYNDLDDWKAFTGSNGGNYTQSEREDVLEAMKLIATNVKSYTSGQDNTLTSTVTPVGTMQEVGGEFIQQYKVSITGATGDRYYKKNIPDSSDMFLNFTILY